MPRPASPSRGLAKLALAALVAAVPGSADAASPEAEVKAAYLYKLASFVRWPDRASGGAGFRLCVAGRNDVAGVLRELVRGQQLDGRPMEVAQVTAAQADTARGCQILFLGRGAQTAQALRSATRGLPVLTVGDRNSGTRGGVIDFVIRNGRVRFAIDRGDAVDRHLEISSKLLATAVAVDE